MPHSHNGGGARSKGDTRPADERLIIVFAFITDDCTRARAALSRYCDEREYGLWVTETKAIGGRVKCRVRLDVYSRDSVAVGVWLQKRVPEWL